MGPQVGLEVKYFPPVPDPSAILISVVEEVASGMYI